MDEIKTASTNVTHSDELHHANEKEDVLSPNVPLRYQGTAIDQRDMAVLGKKQVLRRNFGFIVGPSSQLVSLCLFTDEYRLLVSDDARLRLYCDL